MKNRWKLVAALGVAIMGVNVSAQSCYQTAVTNPTPFMGNDGEVFVTSEGSMFKVSGSFEYLYAYFPTVAICPGQGVMMVEGHSVNIVPLQPRSSGTPRPDSRSAPRSTGRSPGSRVAPDTVALRVRGCDYFVADGPRGYYLLEWYGGYDPHEGDGIFGDIGGYGFKDVLYSNGRNGRLYVDDYMLGKDSVLEKLREKCR